MKCANTAYCGVYRGGYTVFLRPSVRYSNVLFERECVIFSDNEIRVTGGFIHQPFKLSLLRLIAGEDEKAEPFLSIPHDLISAITDKEGQIIWSLDNLLEV